MERAGGDSLVEEHPGILRLEDLGEGVFLVTLGAGPEGPPFVISGEALEALEAVLDRLGKQPELRGLLLRGSHPKVFCAGADVEAMARLTSASLAERLVRRGQGVFARLASLPAPTVALIHGTCVGGGFELALACGARTATPDPETRIGLPEIRLGIIPAWGGCTRLSRLLGLPAAVPLITAGRTLNAAGSLRAGLVDSLVPGEHLLREGLDLAARLRSGPSWRRGRRSLAGSLLGGTAPGRALFRRQAGRAMIKETRGHYPAPPAALRVMVQGSRLPLEQAFELERREVLELLQTPAHRNLLRLFRITREGKRPPIYQSGRDAGTPQEIAVIGAGVMGAGIAALMAGQGFAVRLIDPFPQALVRARRQVQEELARRTRRRDISPFEARSRLARLSLSTGVDGLARADLVIEAVPEKLALKEEILGKVAVQVRPETLMATNTSSFPVGDLARSVRDPTRFLGLHFFNPPGRMPLLEVVRGPDTSDAAVARGLRLATALGKTPVVVRDSPGFLVNRLLAPYFLEACRLAQEGVPSTEVDAALLDFGMPMGPFRLMDEVGLDVILDASRHMASRADLGLTVHPLVEGLVQQGCLGKKSGEGFYSYRGGRSRRPPGRVFSRMIRDYRRAAPSPNQDPRALQDRLVGRMVAEARKVLGEDLVLAPEDVDIGTVFGLGFPAFRGGLLQHAREEEKKS